VHKAKRNEVTNCKPYVSIAQMGNCMICGEHQDLRCGACFDCSDKVSGELVRPGVHKLWETNNPLNEWFYYEDGQ